MNISRKAIDRLLGINWFINIGKQSSLNHTKQLVKYSDFIKEVSGDNWENVTLDAGNEITGCLAKKHTKDYQEWNALVSEAKKAIDNEIIPLLKNKVMNENVILDNVKWDLVSFLMEDAYKKYLKGGLFFEELIIVYENGHIPCGWDGKWPSGRLVIY